MAATANSRSRDSGSRSHSFCITRAGLDVPLLVDVVLRERAGRVLRRRMRRDVRLQRLDRRWPSDLRPRISAFRIAAAVPVGPQARVRDRSLRWPRTPSPCRRPAPNAASATAKWASGARRIRCRDFADQREYGPLVGLLGEKLVELQEHLANARSRTARRRRAPARCATAARRRRRCSEHRALGRAGSERRQHRFGRSADGIELRPQACGFLRRDCAGGSRWRLRSPAARAAHPAPRARRRDKRVRQAPRRRAAARRRRASAGRTDRRSEPRSAEAASGACDASGGLLRRIRRPARAVPPRRPSSTAADEGSQRDWKVRINGMRRAAGHPVERARLSYSRGAHKRAARMRRSCRRVVRRRCRPIRSMPELPEVETTRRGVAPHVVGRRVASGRRVRPATALASSRRSREAPRGRVDRRASTVAASTCCSVSARGALLVHLGMTGSLRVWHERAAARGRTTTSTSCSTTAPCCATTTRGVSARCCGCAAPADGHPLLDDLGPEPFDPRSTPVICGACTRKPARGDQARADGQPPRRRRRQHLRERGAVPRRHPSVARRRDACRRPRLAQTGRRTFASC